MKKGASTGTGGLSPLYQNYEHQKCFIGLSNGARWHDEIENICDKVLPSFELEPWYADHHFDPTKPLLDIVVEMIANARYGIYDLSYWRKDEKSEWVMPRNVFIELGIAIALNRPTLLLHHEESRRDGPKLSESLESIRDTILPFTGDYTLKKALENRLPQWVNAPPEQEWRNRYCHFGNRTCMYREVHPRGRHWVQGSLPCHISHGPDRDQVDFRNVIENVLQDYNDVQTNYLNELVPADGYEFLLCMHCQKVRSTPFAIYRITPQTTSEAFIAIGISIALEKQFDYKIPKILLAEKMEDVPSLLRGEKIVLAKDNLERKRQLQEFLPLVYRVVRKTTWRSRPLPFIEVIPKQVENLPVNQKSSNEMVSDEADVYNEKGNRFFVEKHYEEALTAYKQAIQIAPDVAHYRYNKGLTLQHLNRFTDALTSYKESIQLKPDYALAYGGSGVTYLALQEYQQSVESFNRAFDLDSSIGWVKQGRTEALRLLNSEALVDAVLQSLSSHLLDDQFIRHVIKLAIDEAKINHKDYVGAPHLFAALTQLDDGCTQNALQLLGYSPKQVRDVFRLAFKEGKVTSNTDIAPTNRLKEIFQTAQRNASIGSTSLNEKALVQAVLNETDGATHELLTKLGINPLRMIEIILQYNIKS